MVAMHCIAPSFFADRRRWSRCSSSDLDGMGSDPVQQPKNAQPNPVPIPIPHPPTGPCGGWRHRGSKHSFSPRRLFAGSAQQQSPPERDSSGQPTRAKMGLFARGGGGQGTAASSTGGGGGHKWDWPVVSALASVLESLNPELPWDTSAPQADEYTSRCVSVAGLNRA